MTRFALARGNASTLVLAVAMAASVLSTVALPASNAASTATCAAFSAPVFDRVDTGRGVTLLTLSRTEAGAAEKAGYSSVQGPDLTAAPRTGSGLVGVHRLYRARNGGNYFYSAQQTEIAKAVKKSDYTDQGVAFYAATAATTRSLKSCLVPVRSFYKGGLHRFTADPDDAPSLLAAGWKKEKVRFYLGLGDPVTPTSPVDPPPDSSFSIAVMPDTQQEVLRSDDGRFLNRTTWLVANRQKYNLKFVTHTGDVVNWDTDDHSQYVVAQRAMVPLEQAGIPYSLSIGNHDTQATGPGGGARDATRTRALQRDTHVFNAYLGHQGLDLGGEFETGKVDNAYHLFTAGGLQWLVLNLELWPRESVVAWAEQVVAAHPDDNVIVVTHSYLTADGGIYDRSDYGATSPQYLYDHLISQYANIRLVFSGHVGQAAHRVDQGRHGNRIDSFLTAIHSNSTNPVRMVTIDPAKGTLTTTVYGPWNNTVFPDDVAVAGLSWVR